MPVILVFGRQRQEDYPFKVSQVEEPVSGQLGPHNETVSPVNIKKIKNKKSQNKHHENYVNTYHTKACVP